MELVIVNHGVASTTSMKVAEYFGKRHSDVIRAIETLLQDADIFSRRNFTSAEYTDGQGKPRPMYEMDRDGFTLLAMGFTGKKAMQFKLTYIDAFNKAEEALKHSLPAVSDPQTRALIQLLTEQDAMKQEQSRQALQIAHVTHKIEELTPSMPSTTIHIIYGEISSTAKVHRQVQELKRNRITHQAAQREIQAELLERFNINDIAYAKDANQMLKYLKNRKQALKVEFDELYDQTTLFRKAA